MEQRSKVYLSMNEAAFLADDSGDILGLSVQNFLPVSWTTPV